MDQAGRCRRWAATWAVWLLLWSALLWGAAPAGATALLASAGSGPAAGEALDGAVVVTPRVRAELVAHAPQGVVAGQSFQLGLLFEHAPGWHTYWRNPGDSGMATELHWQLPPGLQAEDIAWPVPMKLRIGELANYGYEQRVLLPVTVHVPPDWQPAAAAPARLFSTEPQQLQVRLEATWLVCKLECIPEQGSFVLDVPLQGSTSLFAQDFARASAAQPVVLDAAGSFAAAEGGRLRLRLRGLPPVLQGEQLEVFFEQPFVIEHGARAQAGWQQQWDGADWVADLPLSAQRAASPEKLALVITRLARSESGNWDPLTHDDARPRGWRVVVPVTAGWEQVAQDVAPSPELLRALAQNQVNVASVQGAQAGWSWRHWLGLLALALAGGALLNLMPCVFPVLAIKALGVARHGGSRAAQHCAALAYGGGVVLSFGVLGAAVLGLRAAGMQLGWGFQLQSPWFVAALALLFMLIGLALLGVFAIGWWLPAQLQGGAPARQSPLWQSFATGVLAVLVASPCTGPFMGAALGATLTLPAAAAMAVFVALGLGLALPFMLLVWFPPLLNRLPRPGAWMETFRNAMAFPMFATVAWLLWVLGQQIGINGMVAWMFALWAVAFALWLWSRRPTGSAAGRLVWLLAVLVPLLIGAWAAQQFAQAAQAPAPAAQAVQAQQGSWQPWSAQQQAEALRSGQPVFVDFTASWCITCQYNKMTTLSDPQVLAAFGAANVRLLRADWTRQNPAITAELQALGRTGVPTYALHVPGQSVQVLAEILDRDALLTQLRALRKQ
ncbi:hypothetical protein AAV94_01140 [Lampropedia cohaerens]|uniref:Thioredoxin domain-containing protein n=1 Tax=Lampropedia cohaerens TaxID=1610491 RepID=A0A0U1Q370_9BURK|nr:hypothetical protein AAV94_01140 [Lampropedia cohaerens]